MRFDVAGKTVTVTAKDAIGKGGEADVYALKDGSALKIFKGEKDPDYAGDANAQEGARRRLVEQQDKLPAFPRHLPPNVVVPKDLARDSSQKIVGYTMAYLQGCEVLLRYGDRRFREQGGVDPNHVVAIMGNLADVVDQIHHERVVVGDFNDLNVLVDPTRPIVYMIDADSFQFGTFLCRTFTPRFLDPLYSESTRLELFAPLSHVSDWYAFAVMLFQSLLYVGPYGGVHRPKGSRSLKHDARVLQRITVFSPDVIYPKPAIHYSLLPDDVLDVFHRVFEKDERPGWGPKTTPILSSLRWTTCSNCGAVHARPSCPSCQTYIKKEPVVVRGNVKSQRVFWTEGTIVCAVSQGEKKLRYLYHNGKEFVRENGSLALEGELSPRARYRISGENTIVAHGRKAAFPERRTSIDVDAYGHLPVIDANSREWYWVDPSGQLFRDDGGRFLNRIGEVLPGRTLIWVGPKFGFGFYRAGSLMRAFVFTERGMNDQVKIPGFDGELVDTTCAFGGDSVWFFATLQENGKLVNHVYVIGDKGELVGHRSVLQTEDDWLATGIRGRFVAGVDAFVPTDEGIVRIDSRDLSSVSLRFADTEPFVDATSHLLPATGGIYVVKSNEISLVTVA